MKFYSVAFLIAVISTTAVLAVPFDGNGETYIAWFQCMTDVLRNGSFEFGLTELWKKQEANIQSSINKWQTGVNVNADTYAHGLYSSITGFFELAQAQNPEIFEEFYSYFLSKKEADCGSILGF